jgi:hypothetical protein
MEYQDTRICVSQQMYQTVAEHQNAKSDVAIPCAGALK